MTDTSMISLCANAMGLKHKVHDGHVWIQSSYSKKSWNGYNPLLNDTEAMALVKKFRINICWFEVNVPSPFEPTIYMWDSTSEELNRAIVECVAKLATARALLAKVQQS